MTSTMNAIAAEVQAVARFNPYQTVHKGMRALLSDVLITVGKADCDDETERAQASLALHSLMMLCRAHLEHEDRFLHSAMEARAPGSAATRLAEHVEHVHAIDELLSRLNAVDELSGTARASAWMDLYYQLSLFVADNLLHMVEEEKANMQVLWAHYTDAELDEIHSALVASIPEDEKNIWFRWMMLNITHGERVGMLRGMCENVPPEVFAGMLNGARAMLPERDGEKLAQAFAA